MEAPVLVKPIPTQVVNEQAAYGPVNLNDFIQAADGSELSFNAELKSKKSLPKGMICTEDGLLTGIPAKGTSGNYEVIVTAKNEAGSIDVTFIMAIKPAYTGTKEDYFDKLKTQIWEALEQNLPIPDLGALLDRPITPVDINYILERWAILIIWDAFNLDPAGEKRLLTLEGVSPHYDVYDRGSCIVAAPKDLYSYDRTLEDALQTARAMAREVYKRGWAIEMAGYFKLTKAVWIEVQHLNDQYGKTLEIINYNPSPEDVKLYTAQAIERIDIERRGPELPD